jgi:hypothetical protein
MPLLLAIMQILLTLFDICTIETYGVEPKCFHVNGMCEKHGQRIQLKKLQC